MLLVSDTRDTRHTHDTCDTCDICDTCDTHDIRVTRYTDYHPPTNCFKCYYMGIRSVSVSVMIFYLDSLEK